MQKALGATPAGSVEDKKYELLKRFILKIDTLSYQSLRLVKLAQLD